MNNRHGNRLREKEIVEMAIGYLFREEGLKQLASVVGVSGTGAYGDDWTEELRGRIVARDGHRCLVCGADDRMLQVHHVDHHRSNNTETNLLILCASCHLAYHGRRELRGAVGVAHAALMERLSQAPEGPPC